MQESTNENNGMISLCQISDLANHESFEVGQQVIWHKRKDHRTEEIAGIVTGKSERKVSIQVDTEHGPKIVCVWPHNLSRPETMTVNDLQAAALLPQFRSIELMRLQQEQERVSMVQHILDALAKPFVDLVTALKEYFGL